MHQAAFPFNIQVPVLNHDKHLCCSLNFFAPVTSAVKSRLISVGTAAWAIPCASRKVTQCRLLLGNLWWRLYYLHPLHESFIDWPLSTLSKRRSVTEFAHYVPSSHFIITVIKQSQQHSKQLRGRRTERMATKQMSKKKQVCIDRTPHSLTENKIYSFW